MFIFSKIAYELLKPSSLIVIGLIVSATLLLSGRKRSMRWGRGVLVAIALVVLAITILPLPEAALTPLEDRFPRRTALPERVDGIIVLGAAINETLTDARGLVALNAEAARLTETLALARLHPEARVLFTGGSGLLMGSGRSEAETAGRFFAEQGLDSSRIVLEDKSRNTYENVLFSKRLVDPKNGDHWVLITSAMHMPRSIGIFRALDWNVIPYPVDYRTKGTYLARGNLDLGAALVNLDHAAKEWVGLIAYRLMGRIHNVFPAPSS